jgi:putative hemolysin
VLAAELAALPASCLLCENRDFQVYCTRAGQTPAMMREIGRQRELTFRLAGEGTGRASDIDAFDAYYDHLFVWQREKREMVAAYRLGAVDEIVRERGIAGLYTSTLFRYDGTLLRRLGPMLELGRSFVRPEYQRSFAALHLLWRGIGQYVARQPRFRFLFGAVSISDGYATASQQLLTSFLQDNCFNVALRDCVQPRNPVAFAEAPLSELEGAEPIADLEALSRRILELESSRRGVPVLLRQYLKLGGSILGLNRDPQFSNVIDGLIVVDLLRAPARVVERYLGAEGLAAVRAQHDGQSTEVAS